MGFTNELGVTLQETVANALNLSSGVNSRNIGIAMARVRGVPNQPILFSDETAELTNFGGLDPTMYSPYVCSNLFDNLGGYGVNIYGLRIVGSGSTPATIDIMNETSDSQTLTSVVSQTSTLSRAQINVITAGGTIDTGDTFTLTFGAVNITYEAQSGDGPGEVALGLYNAIVAYQTANPSSGWATAWAAPTAPSTGSPSFTIAASEVNTPQTITASSVNIIPSPETIMTATAANQGQADPGTWGNSLSITLLPIGDPNGDPNNYVLNVYYSGTIVENYLEADYATLIGVVNLQSNYIMLTAVNLTPALLFPFSASLSGGTYTAPVQSDFAPTYNNTTGAPQGIAIFESYDVQIVCCPEIFVLSFHAECSSWAALKSKFYIFNMPQNATEAQLTTYYNTLASGAESYIAGYLQWCQVDDGTGTGNLVWIPALGYFLGAGYIRACGLNNSYAWTPPGGLQTVANNIYQFSHGTLLDDVLSRYVLTWHCNVVKFVPGTGWVMWSSRTYSDNFLFASIHVRLETTWLAASLIIRGAQFIQKLIDVSFLNAIKVNYLAFMQNLYNQGGIENTITFDDAVVITVDVNTSNRRECDIVISWIPPECAESINITLQRNDGILSVVS